MATYKHNEIDFIERVERLDITDYVQNFLLNFKKQRGISLKTNYFGGANYLKDLLNRPSDIIRNSTDRINGFNYWSEQKVDFVPSNLGENKGYIFYYVCTYCERRVKFLYRYRTYNTPMCRVCCKLGYVSKHTRKSRDISRLIRKPYLSGEEKHFLAKRAGITKNDISENHNGLNNLS